MTIYIPSGSLRRNARSLHSRNHAAEKALGTRTHNFGNLVELSGINCPLWNVLGNVYSSVYACVHTLTGFFMDSNLKFD